ncbi:MAG: alanine racemase, partial [Clostridia bacterium]|nr:alanine racemase [Clostridia bacterium]
MDFIHRTWAEIDISALVHNFELIRNLTEGSKIMAVVKANAYGHSVSDIAPVLDKAGADCFAVSNIDEALQLRELKISKPILILGYTPANCAKILSQNNISQCVYSKEYAAFLSEYSKAQNVNVNVHIKLDTGMSRLGFDCRTEELIGLDSALECARLPHLNLEGVFTHFAVSDRAADNDDGFTKTQFERFKKSVEYFEQNGLKAKMYH